MERNKGQVLTEGQLSQIAKRLFVTMDAANKLALNKEETIEFIHFMKENMYHSEFKPDEEAAAIEAMYAALPKEELEVTIVNPYRPKEKKVEK